MGNGKLTLSEAAAQRLLAQERLDDLNRDLALEAEIERQIATAEGEDLAALRAHFAQLQAEIASEVRAIEEQWYLNKYMRDLGRTITVGTITLELHPPPVGSGRVRDSALYTQYREWWWSNLGQILGGGHGRWPPPDYATWQHDHG